MKASCTENPIAESRVDHLKKDNIASEIRDGSEALRYSEKKCNFLIRLFTLRTLHITLCCFLFYFVFSSSLGVYFSF